MQDAQVMARAGRLEQAADRLVHLLKQNELAPLEAARGWLLLGQCYLGLLYAAGAEHAFTQAAAAYEACGQEELAVYSQLMQARLLIDARELNRASTIIVSGVELAEQHAWRDTLAQGLALQAAIHTHRKELSTAVATLERSFDLGNSVELPWERDVNEIAYANALLAIGQTAQAQEHFEHGENGLLSCAVPRGTALLLISKGYIKWLQGDYPAAREAWHAALSIPQLSSPTGAWQDWILAMAQYNLGLLELNHGDLTLAKKHFLRSWNKAHVMNQQQLACANLTSLSIVSMLQGKPKDAVQYARTSQASVLTFGDIEAVLIYYFLAIALLADCQIEEAQLSWQQKPEMELNSETQLLITWMQRLLDYIRSDEYSRIQDVPAVVLGIAQAWSAELRQLAVVPGADSAGSAAPSAPDSLS